MNATKTYILENIRLDMWNEFMQKIIHKINRKLNIKHEIIYQGILRYFTYVIGITKLTYYIFFPKTKSLMNNKNILISELTFYQVLDTKQIDMIMNIIIKYNRKYRIIIKNKINNYPIPNSINIKVRTSNKNIILNILDIEYKNEFTISKIHYDHLKNMYNKSDSDLNLWICILLLRYRYYGKTKEGMCLCVNILYDFLKEENITDNTLEVFAGSLNSNLKNYCSLFYDIEKYFGSKGSFFTLNLSKCEYKIFVANPPYMAEIIKKTFERIYEVLESCADITVVITVPDWRSQKEYIFDKNIQINVGKKELKRYETEYYGYPLIRNSKYFKYLLFIGDFSYYNFFSDSHRNINIPTLIILLSNKNSDTTIENLKTYIINKIK